MKIYFAGAIRGGREGRLHSNSHCYLSLLRFASSDTISPIMMKSILSAVALLLLFVATQAAPAGKGAPSVERSPTHLASFE